MRKKQLFFMLLFSLYLLMPIEAYPQLKSYTFEQLDSLQKTEKRNVIIFIHTDWCQFCQMMKNTTFKNKQVISTLNKKFWFIELNAEEKKTMSFQGKIFKYQPTGINTGIHDLAQQLGSMQGVVAFPTISILNPRNEIIFQHQQFLSSTNFLRIVSTIK